jgi:hypothetical protein
MRIIMRKFIVISVATLSLAGFAAYAEEERDLANFDQLETSRGVEVTVACGDKAHAVLKGDTADLEVKVDGHTLIVRRSSMFNNGHHSARVELTVAQPLNRIEVSSGTELRVPACAISKEKLDLSASSGADVKLAAGTDHMYVDASSGANIGVLSGGRIDAKEAKIEVSSGASVRVCTVGHLSGRAGTGGSILTENDPSGDTHSSLGGSISTKSCM